MNSCDNKKLSRAAPTALLTEFFHAGDFIIVGQQSKHTYEQSNIILLHIRVTRIISVRVSVKKQMK